MTKTGQRLIESAKEALAFARCEPNDGVVHYSSRMTKNILLANRIRIDMQLKSVESMPKCGREFAVVMLSIGDDRYEIEELRAFYEEPNFCDCETGSDLNTIYNGNDFYFDVIGWQEITETTDTDAECPVIPVHGMGGVNV